METIPRPRGIAAQVKVPCARCGDTIMMTDRQQRRKQQEGRPNFCPLCRSVKVKPPTQSDFNYWLQRFSMDEIREMGRAIWG